MVGTYLIPGTDPSQWDNKGRNPARPSQSIKDAWETAKQLNEQHPGAGEWVPRESIRIVEALTPREKTNHETVRRYAASFDELPPIAVQKDTFVLIDGRHRLSAAREAYSEYIRIIELDISDDEMIDEAIRANVGHGLPLTQEERIAAARKLYERHHPDTGGTTGQKWTDGRIAKWSGVSRRTVAEWLMKDREKAQRKDQYVQIAHTDTDDSPRLGPDNKLYPSDRKLSPAITNSRPAPAPSFPQGASSKPAPRPQNDLPRFSWRDVIEEMLSVSPEQQADEIPDELLPASYQKMVQLRDYAIRMTELCEARLERLKRQTQEEVDW